MRELSATRFEICLREQESRRTSGEVQPASPFYFRHRSGKLQIPKRQRLRSEGEDAPERHWAKPFIAIGQISGGALWGAVEALAPTEARPG